MRQREYKLVRNIKKIIWDNLMRVLGVSKYKYIVSEIMEMDFSTPCDKIQFVNIFDDIKCNNTLISRYKECKNYNVKVELFVH